MEIEKMEAEIRKLSKRTVGGGDSDDDGPSKKKLKKSYLEEELSKYSKGRLFPKGAAGKDKDGKKKKRDESDVLASLNRFRGMLKNTDGWDSSNGPPEENDPEPRDGPAGEEDGLEVDTDQGFLNHVLHFPKDNTEETVKAERDYEVIDPRQRGARAKQEERDRKNAARGKGTRRR
jgi:peptidyl-prolyl cis-trans isomerase SDCCAG10